MTERIIGLSSSHIQAYVSPNISKVKTVEEFIEYANDTAAVKGITGIYPEVDISAIAAGKKGRSGIEIRAVEKDIFVRNQSFAKLFEVSEGEIDSFVNPGEDSRAGAVIGKKLAEDLELHAGDNFRIITTKTSGEKMVPKLTTFRITAVVSSGYQELDQFWVFVPIEAAYSSLSMESATYNVMLETEDAFAPELVAIQRRVGERFGRYANVYRWDQIHTAEFENFSSTKVMLVFVMMLIVLVATVNISSAIVMLVMERQKEIAILKSIGAKPRGITFAFLTAAFACGAGGLVLGLPIGIILTVFSNQIVHGLEKLINMFAVMGGHAEVHLMDPAYYLAEIPVEIPVIQIILIAVSVLILSVLVSYIPSRKAGREKPLEILRKN
jgi:lipoprotein-releasing system permease protein